VEGVGREKSKISELKKQDCFLKMEGFGERKKNEREKKMKTPRREDCFKTEKGRGKENDKILKKYYD